MPNDNETRVYGPIIAFLLLILGLFIPLYRAP